MKYTILLIITAILITSCSPSLSVPIQTAEAQEATPTPEEPTKESPKEPQQDPMLTPYGLATLILTSCIDIGEEGPIVLGECHEKVLACWYKTPDEKKASPGSVINCAKAYFQKHQP